MQAVPRNLPDMQQRVFIKLHLVQLVWHRQFPVTANAAPDQGGLLPQRLPGRVWPQFI